MGHFFCSTHPGNHDMSHQRTSEKHPGWHGVSDAVRRVMQANRSKDTRPERSVRSVAHAMGYRFRIHVRGLPGTPDIVFTARRKVVWVHGCFWHGHTGCRFGTAPRTRSEYWVPKLARNKSRDVEHTESLRVMDWQSIVIWECEASEPEVVRAALRAFLGPPRLSNRKPHN